MAYVRTVPGTQFDIIDCENRAEWLRERLGGICSTDALTLADERIAWDTPYSLWAKKSGLATESERSDNRMDWGNRIEPLLIEWWAEEMGYGSRGAVERRPFRLFVRRDKPHLRSSPDGIRWGIPVEDSDGVEAKTTDSTLAADWDDGVPLRHVVQAQHQMLVTGWRRWHVVVLIGGNVTRRFVVDRDDAFIAMLERRADSFWRRILDADPPPLSGRDAENDVLRSMYPAEREGSRVFLPLESAEWRQDFEIGKRSMAAGKLMMEGAEARIRAALGDAEVGEFPDGALCTLKTETREPEKAPRPGWSKRVLRFPRGKAKRRKTR